jgi:hypothetical protein
MTTPAAQPVPGSVCAVCGEKNGAHRADCIFATGTPNPQHRIVVAPKIRQTASDHLAYAIEIAFNAMLLSCVEDGIMEKETVIPFEGLTGELQTEFKMSCIKVFHHLHSIEVQRHAAPAGSTVEQLP